MISEETDPLQGFLNKEVEKAKNSWLSAIKKDFTSQLALISLLAVEGFVLLAFFSLSPISWGTAISAAIFLFTLFAYFSLRIYFSSLKFDRFQAAETRLIEALRGGFDGEGTTLEERRFVAEALMRTSKTLEGVEFSLAPFKKFSRVCSAFFWHDLFYIRESLLKLVVVEEIERIKLSPLHPDLHVSLANAYVLLAELYKAEKRGSATFQQNLHHRFEEVSNKALLEFKILRQYDPNDPWILFQLAYTLGDLGKKDEELQTFEEVLRLRPHDLDTLHKVGTLYFQAGQTLQGLEIFDQLRKIDHERAVDLIGHYS